MKYVFLIIICFSLLSCGGKNRDSANTTSLTPSLDWLTGNWKRTNDEEGRKTYETWEKISDDEYSGMGWTMENNDTIFKENLRIAKINDQWNLEITGVNEAPTLFLITEFSDNRFISENEQNDFPKKIEYALEDEKLKAIISDNDNEIIFHFRD